MPGNATTRTPQQGALRRNRWWWIITGRPVARQQCDGPTGSEKALAKLASGSRADRARHWIRPSPSASSCRWSSARSASASATPFRNWSGSWPRRSMNEMTERSLLLSQSRQVLGRCGTARHRTCPVRRASAGRDGAHSSTSWARSSAPLAQPIFAWQQGGHPAGPAAHQLLIRLGPARQRLADEFRVRHPASLRTGREFAARGPDSRTGERWAVNTIKLPRLLMGRGEHETMNHERPGIQPSYGLTKLQCWVGHGP